MGKELEKQVNEFFKNHNLQYYKNLKVYETKNWKRK